jgi:hypothetical protein
MYNWFEAEFRKRGKRPTRDECYRTGRELHGLTRHQTEAQLQAHPEWTRDTPPNSRQKPRQLRLWSRGQIDLGFLNLNGKHYGIFFLGKGSPNVRKLRTLCGHRPGTAAVRAPRGEIRGPPSVRAGKRVGGPPPPLPPSHPPNHSELSANMVLFFQVSTISAGACLWNG